MKVLIVENESLIRLWTDKYLNKSVSTERFSERVTALIQEGKFHV